MAERQLDREELIEALSEEGVKLYDAREEELGEELMRALERYLLLQIIDNRWREHLYDMDYLREGIHLRGFAQIEPIVAYKNEAFELFSDLMSSIWSDFARMVFHVEVEVQGEEGAPPPDWTPAAGSQTQGGTITYSGGADAQPSALSAAAAAGAGTAVAGEYAEEDANGHGAVTGQVVQQRRVDADQAIGRNDPCWCGSGRSSRSATARDGAPAADASPRLTVAAGSSPCSRTVLLRRTTSDATIRAPLDCPVRVRG